MQGVLVDDSGTVQRLLVVREPITGERGSGHVVVEGLGMHPTWFDTVEEAQAFAEDSLPPAVKATLVVSEEPTPRGGLTWMTPVWSGQGYLGTAPDEWEYDFRLPSGEVLAGIKAIDEAVQVPDGTRLRYRFRWGGRPGAWSDEGVAALPPR